MKVGVLGTGRVGLVTCVALADLGHEVTGFDEDAETLERLISGTAPFFEPGLQDALSEQADRGRLTFSRGVEEAVAGARIVFICVGTPQNADGEASLLAVERAARQIAAAATGPLVVVEKSTVPAGTWERVAASLGRRRPELAFDVVSNPEFLREGSALHDSLEPTRILVGAESDAAFQAMRELYAPMLERGVRLIETDVTTAELSKHACNAFLALKISYANALARLCERSGADVVSVTEVMGADPRIGGDFLQAGLGFGGYCFPKDVAAFEALSRRLGYAFPLLGEILRINDEAVEAVVKRLEDAVWNLPTKRVAILGLSFKPHTDDVRLSPSLALVGRLREIGAEVVAHDPAAAALATAEVPDLTVEADPYEAVRDAHAVVVATAWPEYETLDWARVASAMAFRVVIDARNALDPGVVVRAGLEYHPVGRPSVAPEPVGG